MGQERRKFKRRYLMYYARVFDKRTGRVIGYVVDLTQEGLMLISEEPVEPNTRFRLRMDLPEDLSEKKFLDFEAESRWCKKDMDPNFYAIGFHMEETAPEVLETIHTMIAAYGFRDA